MIKQAVFVDFSAEDILAECQVWAEAANVKVEGVRTEMGVLSLEVKGDGRKLKVQVDASQEDRCLNTIRENPVMGPMVPRNMQLRMPICLYGGDIEQLLVQDMLKHLLEKLGGYWSVEDGSIWHEIYYPHDCNTGWETTRLALDSGPVFRMGWETLFDHLGGVVEIPDLEDYWAAVYKYRQKEQGAAGRTSVFQ